MKTIYQMNGTCCICGDTYTLGGNNPDPVVIDDSGTLRCCNKCNMEKAIPARYFEVCKKNEK